MSGDSDMVQTGLRMSGRTVRIARMAADLFGVSLGSFVEGIVEHAFEGSEPLSKDQLAKVAAIRKLVVETELP